MQPCSHPRYGLIERSNEMSGESLRAMIVRVASIADGGLQRRRLFVERAPTVVDHDAMLAFEPSADIRQRPAPLDPRRMRRELALLGRSGTVADNALAHEGRLAELIEQNKNIFAQPVRGVR